MNMSTRILRKTVISLFLLLTLIVPYCNATTSGGVYPPQFTYKSGEWYDSWGITRTNAYGGNGYLPFILSETIGENRDIAFMMGENFRNSYLDRQNMAAMILDYVQTWVQYGYDVDNVFLNKVPQDEWAWNADELAYAFNETTGVAAIGDCEDMAFLCATLYLGAGIDIAIVDAPGHVALLIWLPDYPNANKYWDLTNDDRGTGWIWVEATGPTNPLGWTPSEYTDGFWTAWSMDGDNYIEHDPVDDLTEDSEEGEISIWDIIITIIIIVFFLLSNRK
jgi:hypothetical protein